MIWFLSITKRTELHETRSMNIKTPVVFTIRTFIECLYESSAFSLSIFRKMLVLTRACFLLCVLQP